MGLDASFALEDLSGLSCGGGSDNAQTLLLG